MHAGQTVPIVYHELNLFCACVTAVRMRAVRPNVERLNHCRICGFGVAKRRQQCAKRLLCRVFRILGFANLCKAKNENVVWRKSATAG